MKENMVSCLSLPTQFAFNWPRPIHNLQLLSRLNLVIDNLPQENSDL
jgi:hypothetical protein